MFLIKELSEMNCFGARTFGVIDFAAVTNRKKIFGLSGKRAKVVISGADFGARAEGPLLFPTYPRGDGRAQFLCGRATSDVWGTYRRVCQSFCNCVHDSIRRFGDAEVLQHHRA